MRIERIDPREIIPTDAPYKPKTVESLCDIYEDSNLRTKLDQILPFVFIHFVKNNGLYMVDGNHRAGVALMYEEPVNGIFLNTFKDLADSYVLRDLKLIPYFEFNIDIKKKLPHFSTALPNDHRNYALDRGVRNFDDFVEDIQDSVYHNSLPSIYL